MLAIVDVMARPLRPLADREALLALGLAGLGFVSFEATLPAAGVLGVRAIRSTRGGDGCGPAVGVLVLAVAWISFMLGFPIVRAVTVTASRADDPVRFIGFVAGWLALASGAFMLANYLLRTHPERYVARAAARAGIVAIATAGLLQTLTVTADGRLVTAACGASNADCLGGVPWSSIAPALAIGALWFGASLTVPRLSSALTSSWGLITGRGRGGPWDG